MQTKSTKDIQSEIDSIRRQYQQRQDSLNRYLAEDRRARLRESIPWLISAAVMLAMAGFLVCLFT